MLYKKRNYFCFKTKRFRNSVRVAQAYNKLQEKIDEPIDISNNDENGTEETKTTKPLADYTPEVKSTETTQGVAPPPPPPPPPPPTLPPSANPSKDKFSDHATVASPNGGKTLMEQLQSRPGLKPAPPPTTTFIDERSGLLGQIQKGKELRKVTPEMKAKPKVSKGPMNAAELLAQFMDQRVRVICISICKEVSKVLLFT